MTLELIVIQEERDGAEDASSDGSGDQEMLEEEPERSGEQVGAVESTV